MVVKQMSEHWLLKYVDKIFQTKLAKKYGWSFYMTLADAVYYPTGALPPDWLTLDHEMVHAKQYRLLGVAGFLIMYFLIPTGRWRLEREAYLENIKYSSPGPEEVVNILRKKYFIFVPKKWMLDWFEKHKVVYR